MSNTRMVHAVDDPTPAPTPDVEDPTPAPTPDVEDPTSAPTPAVVTRAPPPTANEVYEIMTSLLDDVPMANLHNPEVLNLLTQSKRNTLIHVYTCRLYGPICILTTI